MGISERNKLTTVDVDRDQCRGIARRDDDRTTLKNSHSERAIPRRDGLPFRPKLPQWNANLSSILFHQ